MKLKTALHKMIVPMMMMGTLVFVHPHVARATDTVPPAVSALARSADAHGTRRPQDPTVEFVYDGTTETYSNRIDRTPVAGGSLRVVYSTERRDVLYAHQDRLWLRYSFDGWQTCRDLQLTFDAKASRFTGRIELPPVAGHVSLAFFSTYEDRREWHVLWDSAYGRNFDVKVLGRRELDEKAKVDLLTAYENGTEPDKYTSEAL